MSTHADHIVTVQAIGVGSGGDANSRLESGRNFREEDLSVTGCAQSGVAFEQFVVHVMAENGATVAREKEHVKLGVQS